VGINAHSGDVDESFDIWAFGACFGYSLCHVDVGIVNKIVVFEPAPGTYQVYNYIMIINQFVKDIRVIIVDMLWKMD